MKKIYSILLAVSMFFALQCFGETTTFRVATYNLLKFPHNNGIGRIPALRTVIQAIDPDVLLVEELISESAAEMLMDSVMNYNDTLYARAPFVDGPDTDNLCFYKKDRLILTHTQSIPTYLRNIGKYSLTCVQGSDTFHVYAAHLKAGSESSDREERQWDATLLRNRLNKLPANTYFLVTGDLNVYTGTEPAFVSLTGSQEDNDGRCFDPLNKIGDWHSNAVYAKIHTQSTRTTEIDSGASGGLDDRFDFILCSESFLNPGGLNYIPGSYAAFGNDGLHFNSNIHSGGNRVVNDEVALALYEASDHLPIIMDFSVELKDTTSRIQSEYKQPLSFRLHQNYPNPFNNQTRIEWVLPEKGDVTFSVYDVKGSLVDCWFYPEMETGIQTIRFDASHLSSGIYFYKLQMTDFSDVKKMILMR